MPVADTLKRDDEGAPSPRTIPRLDLWRAQTPQMFRHGVLPSGLRAAPMRPTNPRRWNRWATAAPGRGRAGNFKVTYAEDLELAEMILLRPGRIAMSLRIGHGFDVHRLVAAASSCRRRSHRYPKGLLGQSDADVLLHAICDAPLGAAALGDIGRHFPDTDPRYRGIESPNC